MNNLLKQKSFKKKKFSIDQYWKIYFTEHNDYFWQKEYITVIKARSFDFALEILKKKLSKDFPNCSFKNFKGHMFHKNYQFVKRGGSVKTKLITIKDWENIRNCAFPNENNFLFKFLISEKNAQEIAEFNKRISKGIQKHNEINSNKDTILYKGEYRDAVEVCNELKPKIQSALLKCKGDRRKTAKILKISYNKLYQYSSHLNKYLGIKFKDLYPIKK